MIPKLTRRHFKIFWNCVCLLTFCAFIYIATNDYLKRPVATDTRLKSKALFPALTVCSSYVMAYCSANASAYDGNIKRTCELNLLNHSTAEIFELVPSALREFKQIYSQNGLYRKFDSSEFLKSDHTCFQVRFRGEPSNVTFSLAGLLDAKVYLDSHESHAYPYETDPVYLNNKGSWTYPFKRIETVALPAPYATNCVDYKTFAMEGPGQCLQLCLLSEQPGFNQGFLLMANDSNRFSSSARLTSANISQSKCFSKCSRPSCFTQFFLPGYEHHTANLPNIITSTFRETYPAIYIQYQPMFTFNMYIIYISSLSCTFLGLNALAFDRFIRKIVRKISRRVLRNRRHRLILKCCVRALCCFGCAWQTISASISYFKYSTMSELYVGSPLLTEPPAVSLCFEFKEILKPGVWSNITSHDIFAFNDITEHRYDLLDRLTMNEDYFIKGLNDLQGFSKNGTWIRYFKGGLKCFYYKSPYRYIDAPVYRYLEFETKRPVRRIYLHSRDGLPRFIYNQPILIAHNQIAFTYKYTSVSLLPSPYGQCDDHPNHSSQGECFEKCLKFKLQNVIPADSLLTVSESEFSQSYVSVIQVSQSTSYDDNVFNCRKNCHENRCQSIMYGFSDELQGSTNESLFHEIYIDHPKQIIIYKLVINLNLIEYIIFVCTIVGFWLGYTMTKVFWLIDGFILTLQHYNPVPDVREMIRSGRQISGNRMTKRIITVRWLVKYQSYVKKLAWIFLKVGFLFHVYYACVLYLLHQLVTETTSTHSQTFQIPTFSVCFDISEIYNGSGNPDLLMNLSANELNGLTYTGSQLINGISELDRSGENLVIANSAQVTSYYSSYEKCFRLSLRKNILKVNRLNIPCTAFSISPMNDTISVAFLYIHKDDTLVPTLDRYRYVLLKSKQRKSIGYTIRQTKLLPHPFATDCFEYKDSRQSCIESCIQYEARLRFNASDISFPRDYNDMWPASKEARRSAFLFRIKCSTQICRKHDCVSEEFKYIGKTNEFDPSSTLVTIAPPTLKLFSQYKPKLNMLDFIIYLAGISGLWNDFSLISVYNIVTDVAIVISVFRLKMSELYR